MLERSNSWGIHWFRRDLRIAGNAALRWSQEQHRGRVLGLFAFDRKFLGRADFSPDRFQFFLQTLVSLRDEMRAAGGDLLVLDVGPSEAFIALKDCVAKAGVQMPATVSWCRDYEPFARTRDERIRNELEELGIVVHTERDHLVIEPHELLKGDGEPYKVYSAFAKKWFDMLATDEIQERIALQRPGLQYLELRDKGKSPRLFALTWHELLGNALPVDHLEHTLDENKRHVTVPIPPAGSLIAWKRVKPWARDLAFYGDNRDFMAREGTSKLAMFFKNGSITTSQVIAAYDMEYVKFSGTNGATKYFKELVWREFYYHILWHFSGVETGAFQEKYRDLDWENDEALFERWKTGTTGFPIVDAAMRELATTGLMHNRSRMIVASFLTKDLLIDWRWGEKWFMQKLLDGDLAPNNGGWQWAASTGCDAQPYFRVFNPELQGERFDPDGDYVRRFVQELREVDTKEIHNPSAATRKRVGYPATVVDHGRQKVRAMRMFKV